LRTLEGIEIMPDCDVLIAGAGPTGLVLALWLTRLGVRVRIFDKALEPGQTSRALGVQARTLEQYRQLGLAQHLVDHGLIMAALNYWVGGKRQAHFEFGEMGNGLSPFPYMLVFPQEEHERLLIERLAALGVTVERGVELLDFADGRDGIAAQLHTPTGTATCRATFLAGCDGARSTVRETLKVGYPGGTYANLFYVADVEAEGPQVNGELQLALENSNFVACFPLKKNTHVRLIGALRPDAARGNRELTWEDVNQEVIRSLQLTIKKVAWFSTYRVHHRVAEAFQVGNAFLLGDAAHIHSPVGGQGMNTGIGDAINLAWKLAAVLKGSAHPTILDSYQQERVPFAQRLVHTTDRIFEVVSAEGPIATQLRLHLMPPILRTALRLPGLPRFVFNTVSQINIHYRDSMLSNGQAGHVRGGDRLPWVPQESGGDNFDPLTTVAWQVHTYGDPSQTLRQECAARGLPLHAFPWGANAKTAGLEQDAAYLVRPDGYLALAAEAGAAASEIPRYLDAHGIVIPLPRVAGDG
jgi:2-polyprenyl-6-methoxyphenol hydroxylase-like FAD-dependent oxidoreductase